MAPAQSAPAYEVAEREVVAVEHPMIVMNLDKGLKTFGTNDSLRDILDADEINACLPLYLRPEDRASAPILSYNTPTTNVVLKIQIPRRTGRKRKRGSSGDFSDEHVSESHQVLGPEGALKTSSHEVMSHSRLDKPSTILKALQENIGRYRVEAIGSVEQTHRFRGLADFHSSTTHGPFMTKMRGTLLTGDLAKIKEFKLDPSKGPIPMCEIIPPPAMTDHVLPNNWGYHQNSNIKMATDTATGEETLINKSMPTKLNTLYIHHAISEVPQAAPFALPADDPVLLSIINLMQGAFDDRPIWTRRALINRIDKADGFYLFKRAIEHVGYQFRGGPWRDCIIRYGVDPRSDPKYRIYQTLFFKIFDKEAKEPGTGKPWQDLRSEYYRRQNNAAEDKESHLFDGKRVSLDGKVWQICDITDPLLLRMLEMGQVRPACDIEADGWFCNGTLAKVRAVMRTKISAIRFGRLMPDDAFANVLKLPEDVPGKRVVHIPVPNYRGTVEERRAQAASLGEDRAALGALGDDATADAMRKRLKKAGVGRNPSQGSISSTPKDAMGSSKSKSRLASHDSASQDQLPDDDMAVAETIEMDGPGDEQEEIDGEDDDDEDAVELADEEM